MPIYQYRCRKCGAVNDMLLPRDHRAADLQCESCRTTDLERLVSNFATRSDNRPVLTAVTASGGT